MWPWPTFWGHFYYYSRMVVDSCHMGAKYEQAITYVAGVTICDLGLIVMVKLIISTTFDSISKNDASNWCKRLSGILKGENI